MPLRLPLVAVLAALTGCATGVPLGARAGLHSESTQPFGRPGIRREVPASAPVRSPPLAAKPGARKSVVSTAQALVGAQRVKVAGKQYPQDCSGLVLAAYGQAGVDLLSSAHPEDNAVTAIFRFAREHGRVYEGGWPVPGDLVFFRETYDQNRDGRLNDGLTHIGLVEGVDADGTIRVIHRVKKGVVVYRMNLENRDVRAQGGRKLNDYLRSGSASKEAALTGQLFAAYATVLP